MKVFAISDLHLSTVAQKPMDVFGKSWENYLEIIKEDWQNKVTDDDLVLLCGDFSWAMRMDEALPDFAQIAPLPGKKVIIRGNHDYWWNTVSQVRRSIPQGFYAVQNDCLRFDDVLLCGTRGWVCPEGDLSTLTDEDRKIYLREGERLELSLKAMQKEYKEGDRVICMMHYPPFNARFDDSVFTQLLVRYGIKKTVYGHLHGKPCRAVTYMKRFGGEFYLTSCDQTDNLLTLIDG